MKNYSLIVLLCLLACGGKDSSEAEFLKTIDSFYEAIGQGDQEMHASLFTNDAFMLIDKGHISRGKSLKASIRNRTGWVFRLKDINRLDYGVSGELGFTVNEYFYTWHPEGTKPEWHKTKNVHIWKKEKDGSWRLHVDIWNSTPQ